MSRNLTASDRSALIRLASTLPVGSTERKAILAGLAKTSSGEVNVPGKHILENAQVGGDAKVFDKAKVSGNAKVFGNAYVGDKAQVYGDARVTDWAGVSDFARVIFL